MVRPSAAAERQPGALAVSVAPPRVQARPKMQPRPVVAPAKQAPAPLPPPVDDPACPLCIEALDDTDKDFYPCPCGYQVCLFCYQRLQNEYNNTCPGCRQQYSDDLDGVRRQVERKQQAAAAEAAQRPAAAAGHGHGGGGHRAKAAAAKQQQQQQQRHAHDAAAHARPGAQAATSNGHEPGSHAGSGLPATSSWGVAAVAAASSLHSLGSVESPDHSLRPPVAADESAWPSLGRVAGGNGHSHANGGSHQHGGGVRRQSSSGSLSSLHSQQQQQQQLAGAAAAHQQAASSARGWQQQDPARSSIDSTASTMTGHLETQQQQQAPQQAAPQWQQQHAEEQQQQQQAPAPLQHRSSSGFTAVEVTTVVGGTRHCVCVPVSNHSEVELLPEAAGLLELLQRAVNARQLSATEAAVQLVQCLRKAEADSASAKVRSSWLQQALAGTATRPAANGSCGGAGSLQRTTSAGAGRAAAAAAPAAGAQQRAPPPGFGAAAPAARGATPYAPHLQQQQQQAEALAAAQPYHPIAAGQQPLAGGLEQQQQQQGVTMWSDSGLPGVDFSAAGQVSAAAVPPRSVQALWGTSPAQQQQQQQLAAYAPSLAGSFGSSDAFAAGIGAARLGSAGGGGYNPLAAAALGFGALGDAGVQQQVAAAAAGSYRPWG